MDLHRLINHKAFESPIFLLQRPQPSRRLTQQLGVQAHEENYANAARTFIALEREANKIHTALTALAPLET